MIYSSTSDNHFVQQSTTQLSKASFYILRVKQARTKIRIQWIISPHITNSSHMSTLFARYTRWTPDQSRCWNLPLGFSYELLKRYHYTLCNNTASSPTDNKAPTKAKLNHRYLENFSDHHWSYLGIDHHTSTNILLSIPRAIKPNQQLSSCTAQLQYDFGYLTLFQGLFTWTQSRSHFTAFYSLSPYISIPWAGRTKVFENVWTDMEQCQISCFSPFFLQFGWPKITRLKSMEIVLPLMSLHYRQNHPILPVMFWTILPLHYRQNPPISPVM